MASIINASTSGAGGLVSTADASGVLQLQTAGTTAVTVDASQNIGIGTSSPTQKLGVNGNIAWGTTGNGRIFSDSNWGCIFQASQASPAVADFMWQNGSGAERMRIDSNGNVFFGTTSGSAKINTFVNSSQVGYYQNKPSSGSADHQQFYTDGTLFAKMNNRGSWYNFDNVYGSLSDATLKENINNATPKLDDLMQVEVRNFNFIADENKTKQLGVIAQELEAVFPSMVDTNEDNIKSVKYSVFVPMLIKAIQELKAIVDTQAERIAVLENK